MCYKTLLHRLDENDIWDVVVVGGGGGGFFFHSLFTKKIESAVLFCDGT